MDPEPIHKTAIETMAIGRGATLTGLDASTVDVEVRLLRGLLGLVKIIGLQDSATRESRERVRSAIRSAGLTFPERSLLINLAPAELRKVGPGLDLPIACGVLAVSEQLPRQALSRTLLFGELSLDGRLRPVRGSIAVALAARRLGDVELIVPNKAAAEVGLVRGLRAVVAEHLGEVVEYLRGNGRPVRPTRTPAAPRSERSGWDSIVGQEDAKAALVAAAAGGHHALLTGPPGAGKSLLAKSLVDLLPDLDEETALQVSCIHSAAGLDPRVETRRPPFRAPHCSITAAGLVGGGASPRPGELTLSHRGVLFLDELPHFRRSVIDLLRAPLEDGEITLTRAGRSVNMPCAFQLIAAMNPCPCGLAGFGGSGCTCSPAEIVRYRTRIHGPVLDRIDLSVTVPFVPARQRRAKSGGPLAAATLTRRIQKLHAMQTGRNAGHLNSSIPASRLDELCALEASTETWFNDRVDRLGLSVRAHHRLLRVARTLADLRESAQLARTDLETALSWREPERAELL